MTQIFNVNIQERERKKMEKNWKNKGMEPESQSHICTPRLKIVACTVPAKSMTQISPEKTDKWTNKGKNKNNESDFQSHITTNQCPYVYKVSRF